MKFSATNENFGNTSRFNFMSFKTFSTHLMKLGAFQFYVFQDFSTHLMKLGAFQFYVFQDFFYSLDEVGCLSILCLSRLFLLTWWSQVPWRSHVQTRQTRVSRHRPSQLLLGSEIQVHVKTDTCMYTCKLVIYKTEFSPMFIELSIRFAQNDQPVTHRGWMISYTTCFACKVIMTSQANTPKWQHRTARFF